MSDYNHDQDQYDYDDERFYGETAYNEEYYIERELELIRQSKLDLELEELEERHLREIGEEVLLPPVPIKPGESESDSRSSLFGEFGNSIPLPKGTQSLRPRYYLLRLPSHAANSVIIGLFNRNESGDGASS
jgi:hypothetical protein